MMYRLIKQDCFSHLHDPTHIIAYIARQRAIYRLILQVLFGYPAKIMNANFVSKLAFRGVFTDISPVMHPIAPK